MIYNYIYNIYNCIYIYMHTGSYWNISMVICLYVLNNASQAHSTKVYGANVGNQWYQEVCIWVVSKFLWTSWTTTLVIFNLQSPLQDTLMNHPVFGYHIVNVLKLYRTQLRDDFMIFYVVSFTISLLSSIGQKEHERQNECYNTHTRARNWYITNITPIW